MNFLLLSADKTELFVVRPTKHGHFFDNLCVKIDDYNFWKPNSEERCSDFWLSSDVLILYQVYYQDNIF